MAKVNIGGQAVIEGVMMRGRKTWAIAVRKPDGEIALKDHSIKGFSKYFQFLNWPVFRGIVMLIQTLAIGMKAISYSANVSLGEEEEELSSWQMALTIMFALVFAILLFMVVPYFLTYFLEPLKSNRLLFTSAEGLIRIGIFVSYITGISFIKDIRRVFQYHGAEHKVINAFEGGSELTTEDIQKYSTVHVSCGTSFLLLVLVLAIAIFSFLPVSNILLRFGGKLLIVPLISGVSYELIRIARKYQGKVVKFILAPGLLLQKITTREPSNDQVEVALAAFNRVAELELKA